MSKPSIFHLLFAKNFQGKQIDDSTATYYDDSTETIAAEVFTEKFSTLGNCKGFRIKLSCSFWLHYEKCCDTGHITDLLGIILILSTTVFSYVK